MNHVPAIPLLPLIWSESWTPSTPGTPGVKTFTRKSLSGVVTHYVASGNADAVPRQFGSGRPAFDGTLTVQAPRGYTLIEDCPRPWFSRWWPMRVGVRRYGLYKTASPELRAEAEREARGHYDSTRWRRGRLAYGPCLIPLPDLTPAQSLNEAGKVSGWLAQLRLHLMNGTVGGCESVPTGGWDYQEGPVTPAVDGVRAFGPPERGAQAGSGIFAWTGWEQSSDWPALAWLESAGYFERMWTVLDRATGEPITPESYGDPGPMFQAGSSAANNRFLPEFQGVAPWPDPINLPYDQSHSIRGFRHLIALSEMIDHPVIGWMLRCTAAHYRLQLSDKGPIPQSSGYVPPSLRTYRDWAKSKPHTGHMGMDVARQMEPAIVIAQSVKRGKAANNKAWCAMFCDFVETATMPNGMFARCHAAANPSDVWYDPTHDLAHAFEQPWLMLAYIGCAKVIGRTIPQSMTRFAAALYEEAPLLPYYSGVGPPNYAYVAARNGAPYPSIPGGKGNAGDSSHVHVGAALAAHIDPAQRARWIASGLRVKPISDMRESAGLIGQQQL